MRKQEKQKGRVRKEGEEGEDEGRKEEEKWREKKGKREGGEMTEYRAMGEKREIEIWRKGEKEKRRAGVVDAIGEDEEARRKQGRKKANEMLRREEEKREKKGFGEKW